MILNANNKMVEFNEKVEELTKVATYNKVNESYSGEDFKVMTRYSEGEYENTDGIEILINGKAVLGLFEGEPEDMIFGRNLNDALKIPELIKIAYLAGKKGTIMYQAQEIIEEYPKG